MQGHPVAAREFDGAQVEDFGAVRSHFQGFFLGKGAQAVGLGDDARVGGEEAVESFAAARSREIERRYAPIVRDAGTDPRVRAQALADALTQDGYAATVRDIGGGTLAVQLCQGHCPIQNVAGDFPQLCDAETIAFGKLLDVHVQRLSTLAGGGHVCTTHIPVGMPIIRPGARNVRRK